MRITPGLALDPDCAPGLRHTHTHPSSSLSPYLDFLAFILYNSVLATGQTPHAETEAASPSHYTPQFSSGP